MALTDAGRDNIAAAIMNDTPAYFTNATAHIGVGDSSTVFAASQTDLVAATNKLRKAMDSTFPTRATNVLTFRSTFATGDANWAWQEWGIFSASSAGTMLSRKVESLGTKTSAQSWQITAVITVNNP